jgi:pimeloyl-ACP methyl ester carboxylesterase
MNSTPRWLNRNIYPFESKWATLDGHGVHYIDEGKGETILFVHGTPEWSFGFRDQVRELRNSFRCVAMDHLGFGLSDKPQNADYSVAAHTKRLAEFIRQLGLKDITIVANDFGGGIALGYALADITNIKRIAIFNTWMWSLKNDPHYAGPAKTLNTWLGRFLYLRLNASVNMIMPAAYGDRKKLTKEVHQHYKNVVPTPASRVAVYAFAKELMNASDYWQSLWDRADLLAQKPMLIMWGMKDKFVPAYEFEKWKKRFPNAKTIAFENAGHFVQEEQPEMAGLIRDFMK